MPPPHSCSSSSPHHAGIAGAAPSRSSGRSRSSASTCADPITALTHTSPATYSMLPGKARSAAASAWPASCAGSVQGQTQRRLNAAEMKCTGPSSHSSCCQHLSCAGCSTGCEPFALHAWVPPCVMRTGDAAGCSQPTPGPGGSTGRPATHCAALQSSWGAPGCAGRDPRRAGAGRRAAGGSLLSLAPAAAAVGCVGLRMLLAPICGEPLRGGAWSCHVGQANARRKPNFNGC